MISRRILAAVALLCALTAPSYAQKSKATLTTEINTNWPDNSNGAITPAILRSTVIDIVNSYVDWLTCTGTGGVVYWNAGTPTCLTVGSNGQVLGLSAGLPAWINTSANFTAGTGITLTGTTNVTISLTNQVAAGGPSGSATTALILTYNAQGQITAVSTATITPALGSVTGVPANSFVANNTGSPANGAGVNGAQAGAMLCAPSRSLLGAGTNQTYTVPTCNSALPTRIELEFTGGGGGGAGSGTTPGVATAGGQACFGTNSTACSTPIVSASGGALGSVTGGNFSAGGTTSGCDLGITGQGGGETIGNTSQVGGFGASSFFGGGGVPGGVGSGPTAQAGQAAVAGSGSGGGGASSGSTANNGGGGAAGGYCRKLVTSPVSSYFYTTGTAGAGGTLGTSGAAGGNGAAGPMIVTAYWQ